MELKSINTECLGTMITLIIPKSTRKDTEKQCIDELHRIEKTYSRFADNSALSHHNSNLNTKQKTTAEFIYLLLTAQKIKKQTQNYFDITIKSHLDKLGYNKTYTLKSTHSSRSRIQHLKDILLTSVKINKSDNTILLRKQIDFGGLGKGFALDQIKNILEKASIDRYCINAGGDIYAKSTKDNGWKILLEHPDDNTRAIGHIHINDMAIASSSASKRKWGKSHHLINAKTGIPADNMKQVSVLAKTGIEADAYATALFTSGFEKAISLSKTLPIEVLLISKDNKIFKSKNFKISLYD